MSQRAVREVTGRCDLLPQWNSECQKSVSGLEDCEGRALGIAEHSEAADVVKTGGSETDMRAEQLGPLRGGVNIIDPEVGEPVRRHSRLAEIGGRNPSNEMFAILDVQVTGAFLIV